MLTLVAFLVLASDPLADARLDKPVTVEGSLLTLPEVMEAMSAQTGVKLTAWPDAEDHKLNVYVRNVPARRAMRWIASVLDCQWKESFNHPCLWEGKSKLKREPFLAVER